MTHLLTFTTGEKRQDTHPDCHHIYIATHSCQQKTLPW